eukprot:1085938-Pyramimonas_sp.AAC.1
MFLEHSADVSKQESPSQKCSKHISWRPQKGSQNLAWQAHWHARTLRCCLNLALRGGRCLPP